MEQAEKPKSFADWIQSDKAVLVDFSAEWCGPCKMMKPILDELKGKMKEDLVILKVDVDRNPEAAQKYRIQGVPTLILFQKGKQLWRESGVMPARELEAIVRSHTV